jgi:para-nitrobenzyl esterase
VIKRDPNAPKAAKPKGAVHSAEIEYALGNLSTNLVYDWQSDDYKVSKTMQEYFANFIKNYDPNGPSLGQWAPAKNVAQPEVMIFDVDSKLVKSTTEARYEFLDKN